jgi:hypothetical protein
MDEITFIEYKYYEKCFNAGLTYFNQKYKDIDVNCFGYDFKRFYPTILNSDILIPTKQGKETKFEKLPDKLQYGIYKNKNNIVMIANLKRFLVFQNIIIIHILALILFWRIWINMILILN